MAEPLVRPNPPGRVDRFCAACLDSRIGERCRTNACTRKFFPTVVGADLLRVLLYVRISVVSSPVVDRSFKALCAADAAVCHGCLRVLILADTDSKSRTTKTSVACVADRFGSLCGVLDDHQLPDLREEMA